MGRSEASVRGLKYRAIQALREMALAELGARAGSGTGDARHAGTGTGDARHAGTGTGDARAGTGTGGPGATTLGRGYTVDREEAERT